MAATEKTGLLPDMGSTIAEDPTLKWRILFYVNGEKRAKNLDV